MDNKADIKSEAKESFTLCIVCSAISFALVILCFIFREKLKEYPELVAIIYGVMMMLFVIADCRKIKKYFSRNGVLPKAASLYALLFGANLMFEVFLAIYSWTALFVAALVFNAAHLVVSIIMRFRLIKED